MRYLYRLPALLNPTFDVSGLHNIFGSSGGGELFETAAPEDIFAQVEKLGIKPEDQLTFLRTLFDQQQARSLRIRDGLMATAQFDMMAPLKPQLKTVELLLKSRQKDLGGKLIQFRKRRDFWPLYLRLLDAEHQGNPKPMEIYDHLLHESEQHNVTLYDRLCVPNPVTLITD